MSKQRLEPLAGIDGWMPIASGEAQLGLPPEGKALKMEFDFKGGGGFVVARKEVGLAMPEAFAIRFSIRGKGPLNHLELKLADASGQNVWRWQRKNFRLPRDWRVLEITSELLEFAWGPAGGGAIAEAGAVELAVVAGRGGRGTVWVSALQLEDRSFSKTPAVRASSTLRGHKATAVLDHESASCWRPAADDKKPWITLHSKGVHVLGGLVIDWESTAPASGFAVKTSNDGKRWRTVYRVPQAGGGRSYVYLPHTRTRHLKLELRESAGIRALRWQPFEFSRSIDSFFHAVARQEPRGWHPRWLHREQSLWTPAGVPGGQTCALINEQGMVEIDEGTFSLEPFVYVDGKLFTWADVAIRLALRDGWQPVPSVTWQGPGWTLHIELEAGTASRHVRYLFEDESGEARQATLFMALRPFQVTPPWQHFRNVGGTSPIHHLAWHKNTVWVNGLPYLALTSGPSKFGAMTFAQGSLAGWLARGELPPDQEIHDSFGYASGALGFSFGVEGSGKAEAAMAFQLSGMRDTQLRWDAKLPAGKIKAAGTGQEAVLAQLTAASHILVTQSGQALQPGPRRYTRSWIRDGTIMSAALLRMGCREEVEAFIRWYAPHQRADGFVPCCVDRDGVDWLVEHDSHGQLASLVMDFHRFTDDLAFLRRMWPYVRKAVDFIGSSLGEDGLLPVSASHEGYLAHPVHSFWDDFWALRGLRDAAEMAGILGHQTKASRLQRLAEKLSAALSSAVERTRRAHDLQSIPASVEWADFDPTATANAITLLDIPPELDQDAVNTTFDTYMADWRRKRTGALTWNNYTAYEIRIIGALVRLGRRDDAQELLRFFLADRRPLNWNQWPEISWRDPQAPGHIGDVPHTWIAAEYVLAVRTLFAHESESSHALVLAAGIASDWLEGEGVQVEGMPTIFGPLSYRLTKVDEVKFLLQLDQPLSKPPPGGIILRPPMPGPIADVSINGQPSPEFGVDEVAIRHWPARVVITCRSPVSFPSPS